MRRVHKRGRPPLAAGERRLLRFSNTAFCYPNMGSIPDRSCRVRLDFRTISMLPVDE